jgi:hypothetical protein
MPEKIRMTVEEAVEMARTNYNINMSKPTIIKYASSKKYGYQLGGPGSKWIIIKEQFRRFLLGQNNTTSKKGKEKVSIKTNGGPHNKENKIQEKEIEIDISTNSIHIT